MNRLFRRLTNKGELKKNLEIQMNNNKILRANLKAEQEYSRKLEQELNAVKNNLRIALKDNEELAKMLNELVIKYNVKFETNEKTKAKRTNKKKGE